MTYIINQYFIIESNIFIFQNFASISKYRTQLFEKTHQNKKRFVTKFRQ